MSIKRAAVCMVCGVAVVGWAEPLPVSLDQNRLRLTYESVELPQDESMGLVGLNYQIALGSYGYGGLGVYGAAAGERGGFFVGGFEGGMRYPFLSGWEVEGGLFVGGGGGGAAPQGGGLMLRPHLGFSYGSDAFRAGLQLSRVEFPNGDISSTQVAGVIDIPFESFRLDGDYSGELQNLGEEVGAVLHRSLEGREARLGIVLQHYAPIGDVHTTGGEEQKSFETVGVQYTQALGEHLSWHLSTSGAAGGESDGYAELYAGLGYRYPVADTPLSFFAEGSLGMAGGGRVDTGGGAMMRASAGVGWVLTPGWSLNAEGGVVSSFDGDFEAKRFGLSMERRFGRIVPSEGPGGFIGEITRSDWAFSARYEYYRDAARKNHDEGSVGLTGLQAQRLYDWGYLYAKAMGAITGDAGGYVSGSLGAGVAYPLTDMVKCYAQVGLGAAGGGGIDVSGGGIAEGEAGVSFDITPNTEITIAAGMIHSFDGELSSPTLSIGIGYRFGTLGY
ncbi:hypothetical protein [Sulfurovum mangrovi]|uniref:hypothetical protein n=1 Tax=Sulfurovum mangrovi TaxID=2893889 RepID=UPI001E366818|nr:hypothetical protein [Sulfurovum mangrovi]UFH59205.1 hypothetical protein LN246_12810 [Sulfurovum mangrovi]